MYESYPDGVLPCEGSKDIFEKSFSNIPTSKAELKKYTFVKNYNDLMTIEGSGVITEMTLRVKEGTDLSKVIFYICFDHARAPQVSCPVSSLFAQPIRWEDINSYALTSKRENGYVTTSVYLPMPFFEKMYLGMIKLVPEEIEIEFGVVIDENNYDRETTGYFYADYKEGPTALFYDWNIGEFPGRGHIVGLSQSCVGGVGGSYCEGNEHYYINGERSPRINGTGTEDIYLGCYWPNMKFDSPCAGCINDVYLEVDSNLALATTKPIMYYRYYLDMPIAFDAGIKLDVQHGAVCQNFSDYETTCFSYRRSDASYKQTDYIKLSSETSREMHEYKADGQAYTHEGKLESDMRAAVLCETGYKTEDGKVDFSKDFFGKSANLTVSGQLEGETYAMAFGNIYTFGPTFRAENSNTARHAAEFWMIEPEIAFADLDDDMQLAWDMIKYIINHVMDNCKAELEFFNSFVDKTLLARLTDLRNADYAKVTYTEAIEILEKSKADFKFPVYWGVDLQTEHERYLTEQVYKKPIFLIDYPKEIKAFYMRQNDDGKTVAAMDLLVPGVGEIIGGSQREERLEVLSARMKELGLKEEDYWWYLNLRKYGGTKHAGFGLGFERIIMYLTGVSNIRDVIPYPRTVGNAEY